MRGRNGFTLSDLAAALAVAGLAAGLLLPVLGNAREKEGLAVCTAGLKQIGQAVQAYAHDYDGYLIISGNWHTGGWWPTQSVFARAGYMRRMDNWVCPSIQPYSWNDDEPGRTHAILRSHAPRDRDPGEVTAEDCSRFNEKMWEAVHFAVDDEGRWLDNIGTYIYFPRISSPEEYFLAGEMSQADPSFQRGDWSRIHGTVNMHMRHGEDRSNLAFADGSVETVCRGRIRELDAVDRVWKHNLSGWENL